MCINDVNARHVSYTPRGPLIDTRTIVTPSSDETILRAHFIDHVQHFIVLYDSGDVPLFVYKHVYDGLETHQYTMIALLALLANLAVTVVSAQAQDFNSIHNFNNWLSSGCGSDWPVSCSANPPPSNLCCYESPGVSQLRHGKLPLMLTHVLGAASPNAGLSTLMN